MGRIARIIDPKRIDSLQRKINDHKYISQAVSGLAEVMTYIICKDNNAVAQRSASRQKD